MHTIAIFTLSCILSVTFAQYDSPAPPRPIIPGALPLGAVPAGARPLLRRRPQAAAAQEAPLPPKRISTGRGGTGGPARRLPPLLEQSLVSQRPSSRPSFSEPILRAPQLPSPPPIPASAAPAQSAPLPQHYSPQPLPQISPKPVIEELEEEDDIPSSQHIPQTQPQLLSFRPSPIDDLPSPPRPQFHRPTPAPQPVDDDIPTYVRQSRPQQQEAAIRQPARQSHQEKSRQQTSRTSQQAYNTRQQQVVSRPVNKELEKSGEPESRPKKPEVQNIRKYRVDNEDGSITWGFENDDGTYKEETIGTDCFTRGKYGYYDPDGVRREFTYESGIPCDKREQETQETNEGYIDYTNNKYVFPNGDAIDLENMVKNKARKQPVYRN